MTSASTLSADAEDSLDVLLELRFPARADRLKLVRGSVRAAARMCGFNDPIAQYIVLAVDEACQNIIVHGYKKRGDGEIILGMFRGRDGITVRLRDFAPPVDPATIKPRALTDIRPGRLGTHFIHEIMDTAEYRPSPAGSGNILEMTRRRNGSPWRTP